jgi:hypothetical protein
MGAIHTFIIKVVWTQQNPQAMHGLLTCVATGEKYPFSSSIGLLDLLTHLQRMLPAAQPDHPDADNPKETGR